jgi:predicted kinase
MARLVCGPTGVCKKTHSLSLANEIKAIKFSIDPWMQTLFSKDMTYLDFEWMIERVNRCLEQIWQVSEHILAINGNVILDLGFTTKAQKDSFANRARELGLDPEIQRKIRRFMRLR